MFDQYKWGPVENMKNKTENSQFLTTSLHVNEKNYVQN